MTSSLRPPHTHTGAAVGLLMLGTLWMLGGCTAPVPPADPAGLVPLSVRVDGAAWTLLAPPEARLGARYGPGATAVSFAPDTRANPTLTLEPLTPGSAEFPRSVRLASGATLRYQTEVAGAVGSGGDEATLRGRLTMPGGPGLAVACATQSEAPDAAWCVGYLHHLRPE